MEKFFFPKKKIWASEVVKIEKSSYFVKKTPKTWFCTKKVKKTGENMLCQLKTLLSNMIHWFMHKNHVYNDLSWVIWCILLYFSPKWAFCQNLTPLRFGIPVETLKLNKMAVFAWINLKIKICELYTTKFGINKKNSKNIFLEAREGSKSKKVAIFGNKIEKMWFSHKKCPKNGKNIFFQQQTLFLYRIHWFMHKNQV